MWNITYEQQLVMYNICILLFGSPVLMSTDLVFKCSICTTVRQTGLQLEATTPPWVIRLLI